LDCLHNSRHLTACWQCRCGHPNLGDMALPRCACSLVSKPSGKVYLTGVVSAATLSSGFVGYLWVFIEAPAWVAIIPLVFAMGALAALGNNPFKRVKEA
jgi:hypothetical protein